MAIAGLLALLGIGALLALCESAGWPFLRQPAERWLSERLDRSVSFAGATPGGWRLQLLGGIALQADRLQIAGPAWSPETPTLIADAARLELRYRDLLALQRGQALTVKSLQADRLALRLQRQADGRASWQFGAPQPAEAGSPPRPALDGLQIERLLVRQGSAEVNDQVLSLSLQARFALEDGGVAASPAASSAASAAAPAASQAGGMHAEAEGRYQNLPLKARWRSGSALPWLSSDPQAPAVPVEFRLELGRARLDFDGQVRDLLASQGLVGRYQLSGPSLAAVGEALGMTLPATPAFSLRGQLKREGPRWSSAVEQASIGRSRLAGDFVYQLTPGQLPRLSGELRGSILWLADLGPAIGVAQEGQPATARTASRLLPDRQFDLPSLRSMNADVRIKLDRLESGSPQLQAVAPLTAQLTLQDGVLLIDAIDARLAQGRIAGKLQLDGRGAQALWDTQLSLRGLKLEQWLRQPREDGGPPYVTGRLGGRLDLRGKGRSTAELLASADGRAALFWTQGTISHLVVEAAGIDLAEALGLLLRGDHSLAVNCGTADLKIQQGLVTPQLMLVDTPDTVFRVEGSISLASEQLDLRARVLPKDISPLSLRTPLRVRGTLADPDVSLEKGPLLQRLLPAALLALVNPLAALLPLIDLGDQEARDAVISCRKSIEAGARKAGGSKS